MTLKIALVGNPNCGKTTMFNDLTGSSQYVGNWPGVTVEKKEGKLKGHKNSLITDLPGIYSLSPYTLEEVVSRNYLLNDYPDAIINLIDGTNLERNLYLTTQIIELGIPVVLAINMMDVVKKNGDRINVQQLEKEFGCPVVQTSAVKGVGSKEAAYKAIELAEKGEALVPKPIFSKPIEDTLETISALIHEQVDPIRSRWYAIKYFERDEKVLAAHSLPDHVLKNAETTIREAEDRMEDDSESIITNERYEYIEQIVRHSVHRHEKKLTISDRIDRVVTNRFLSLPIFIAIIWFVYYVSVTTLGSIVTDWTNDTLFGTWVTEGATNLLNAIGTADWLNDLIVDGIISGVGTVLGFVPQMMILFFFLSILEDSGYMARVAFIMDRLFRRFGLSGKAFIPILISSGCGVPGIMATRTIENDHDRRMTIMLTTFIPCGAKMVIITMFVATFFHHSSWVAPTMYLLGIAMIAFSGIILKKTKMFAGEPAPFVMELPAYHLPSLKGVWIHVWERSKHFIVKAGTIIFIACGLIWFLSSFGWNLRMVEDVDHSILAGLGNTISWVFAPLGFGSWKGTVATISALVAKENAISSLAVLNGVADEENTRAVIAGIGSMFTSVSALSFMLFNLFNPPCFAAIGATSREMGGIKWTIFALGYQVLLGYSLGFVTYQLGSVLFLGQSFGFGAALALVIIVIAIYLLVRPAPAANKMILDRGQHAGA
ncbi:ferrous iron transport protein B [Sporolactobacillus inulinus]|uniref:Ferrous iron transport protein B n=3 Tax=Sporolactobacillus inulinus TaxID=2078 RepID=A0A0U1QMI4_9BACL|nr:ferrous iron transport protein B [Sporolactobacillus inulinus]KLI02001.1 iron transporter FeoB [Sporolactobacillus inulinus CASD]GEB78024.1 ferrous iron transport protein B [Sporolactobacillus inulinus]